MIRLRKSAYIVALLWLGFAVVTACLASLLPVRSPTEIDLSAVLAKPNSFHWTGTDELGRNVLTRVVFAARTTLLITVGATVISTLLGVLLGMAAGFMGGWIDSAVNLVTDLFWAVPFVVFVILVVSITGVSVFSLILTIGGINWVSSARVVRAETARLRNSDFVLAGRSLGYPEHHLLLSEILPNMRKTVLTLGAYCAIEVMTLETGLAFLGLSIPAPAPTWGGMLSDGLAYFSSAWWVIATTALVVTLTLGSIQVIARGLEKTGEVGQQNRFIG